MANSSDWRILIVEDEPDGQEVAMEMLGSFGITADVVGSAEEALNLLEQHPYSAAIIDLALPQMDGLTLLKTIRKNPATSHLPCIAYTAYHSSLVKKQALEVGCNAYLTKPVDYNRVLTELTRIIG